MIGAKGAPGANGTAGEGIENIIANGLGGVVITTSLGRKFEVPLEHADPDTRDYPPILRWRGVLQDGEYTLGDVVKHSNTIMVAKRDLMQAGDVANSVDDWDVILRAQSGGGGGSGAISSIFGRTGAVVAADSDYDADQVDFDPSGTNLSSTDVQAAVAELDSDLAAHDHDGDYPAISADDTTSGAMKLAILTQAQYDAIGTKDDDTLYFITS